MPDFPAIESLLELHRHPLTPASMVRSLTAGVTRTGEGLLFSYHLGGDMARLLIPQEKAAEQSDGLWEHTCFEAFVGIDGDPAYREFNFSPSGQWACYDFSAYRHPAQAELHPSPPRISTQLTEGHLRLQAFVAGDDLPAAAGSRTLRVALSAVVETRDTVDGNRSYWALRHLTDRPDFHHPGGFMLELPPPEYRPRTKP